MVKLAKLDISGVLNSRPVCQIVKVTTVFGLMLKMIRKLAKLVISIAKSLDSACLITKKDGCSWVGKLEHSDDKTDAERCPAG